MTNHQRLRKIRSVAASRVEHPKQKTNVTLISSPCPSCTQARAGCLTRGVATERIFLIIHNFRIFHPNNLKFWEKLLCTYMNNLPAGSFLYVELPPILFVGKVRKTRTTARINFLLNIYKQSTVLIA